MKCRGFDAHRIEQGRLQGIEHRMPELMGNYVWALARKDRPAADVAMEEAERHTIVIGVQIVPFVEQHWKEFASHPFRRSRHQGYPRVPGPAQRVSRIPPSEPRITRLIDGRFGRPALELHREEAGG